MVLKRCLKQMCILVLAITVYQDVSAQPWITYNTGNGLANNTVRKIAIDPGGNKWFATDNGVSRFTGSSWTTYREQNGLASNYVSSVVIDAYGRKWFGTANGVSVLNGATWTTYTTANGLVDNSVYDITVDDLGNIWVATGNGASRFDGTTWTTFNEGFSVFVVEKDPLGNIWLGPGGVGLCKFDGTNWTYYSPENSGLISQSIYAIAFDHEGNKWIGTNWGVSKFDDVNWTTFRKSDGLPAKDVYAIAIDAEDHKWFGTWEGGVAEFDDVNWSYYTVLEGLASDKVWDIVIADNGDLWIGTKDGGVSKYDGSPPLKHGPDWKWAIGSQGDYNGYNNAVFTGPGGDLFITGAFGGDSIKFGSIVLYNEGNFIDNNIFIARIDPEGNYIWAKSAGGANYADGYEITGDGAGNIFITGRFRSDSISFDTQTLYNSGTGGTGDIFICKYSPDGLLIWAKRLGGIADDLGKCAATDAAGNFIIAGSLDSNIFLAAFSPGGNMLWLKNASGDADFNETGKIITDKAGNIYLSGSFGGSFIQFGTLALENTEQAHTDGFLYKFNSSGDVLWAKRAAGTEWENGSGLALDPAGNLYFTGTFNGYTVNIDWLTLYNTNMSYYDYFLVKISPEGILKWGLRCGGISSDFANGIATDTLGNIYLTGEYKSPTLKIGNTTLPNAGYTDVFISKYNSEGDALWAKRIGGKGTDQVSAILADGDGNIYLTGNFASNKMKFDDIVLTNNGYYEIYNARLGSYISNNSPVCEGSELFLSTDSVADAGYAWRGPGGFYSTLRNPVVSTHATPGMNGKYYLTLTVDGQPYKAGHTTIVVRPIPSPPVTGSIGTLCAGTPLMLTATSIPGSMYSWSGPQGFSSNLQNPVVSQSVTDSMSGTYSVTGHLANCPDVSASIDIKVFESPPVPVITWETPNLVSTAAPGYKWYLNGNEIPGDTLQNCTPQQNGAYEVKITDINGCQAASDVFDLISYGISDHPERYSITIVPNPTTGAVNITCPSGIISFKILDIKGTVIQSIPVKYQKNIKCEIEKSGIYFLYPEGDICYPPQKIVVIR